MRTEQSVATQIFALVIPAFAARADVFTLYPPIRAYTSIERGVFCFGSLWHSPLSAFGNSGALRGL
jgi:hypothetical protein